MFREIGFLTHVACDVFSESEHWPLRVYPLLNFVAMSVAMEFYRAGAPESLVRLGLAQSLVWVWTCRQFYMP